MPSKKPVATSKTAKPKKLTRKVARPQSSFPIVGIGASAGGLEALELFLANVPANSGMALIALPQKSLGHADLLHGTSFRIPPNLV